MLALLFMVAPLFMLAVILAVLLLFMLPMLLMLLDFLMRPLLHSVPTTFVIFEALTHITQVLWIPVIECVRSYPRVASPARLPD